MKITADILRESIELKGCTNEELAKLQLAFEELSKGINDILDERTGWDDILNDKPHEPHKMAHVWNAEPKGKQLDEHICGCSKRPGFAVYELTEGYNNWTIQRPNWTTMHPEFISTRDGIRISCCDIKDATLMLSKSYNFADSCSVCSDGKLVIEGSAQANNTVVHSAGDLLVRRGGYAYGTEVMSGGTLELNSGGSARGTDVRSSALMRVLRNSGGCAYDTQLTGHMHVTDATVSGVTMSEAILYVNSGAHVDNVWAGSDSYLSISSGVACNVVLDHCGAKCAVWSGGRLINTSVGSDCSVKIYSSGYANNMVISSGASVHVLNGGTVNDARVLPGGILNVDSGGSVLSNGKPLKGIYGYDSEGRSVEWTAAECKDVYVFNISCGCLHVHNSESLLISRGGCVYDTQIYTDGSAFVHAGGTLIRPTVFSGGALYVYSGGVVQHPNIVAGGRIIVNEGGIVK